MLTQDEIKSVGEEWSSMTLQQREAVQERVRALRLRAKAHGPLKVSILRAWLQDSEAICEESDTWLWPVMFEEGVQWAIECAVLERLFSSKEVASWEAAQGHIENALLDPVVSSTPKVVAMLQDVLGAINDNADRPASESLDVWDFLRSDLARKEARTVQARIAAMSKNARPRAWVSSEWINRSDKGQSKASFARQYAPLVKNRFGVDVTPNQIERVWLPKGC